MSDILSEQRISKLREALKNIKGYSGQTNLGRCCVEKSCAPVFENGEKVAYCAFQYGVNRGYESCAGEAAFALQEDDMAAEKVMDEKG